MKIYNIQRFRCQCVLNGNAILKPFSWYRRSTRCAKFRTSHPYASHRRPSTDERIAKCQKHNQHKGMETKLEMFECERSGTQGRWTCGTLYGKIEAIANWDIRGPPLKEIDKKWLKIEEKMSLRLAPCLMSIRFEVSLLLRLNIYYIVRICICVKNVYFVCFI